MLGASFPWCVAWADALKQFFAGYVEAKQHQNVLDYDDLLLCWAQAVGDPDLAEEIGSRFDHLFVDEYQDTNRLQASILLALKPDGHGLTVVGDDAQSIYSFRAAEIRNILDFPQSFEPPAEIITLDRNYRSTQPILAAANGVIELARERFTKNLWTERESATRPRLVNVRDEADQARFVAEQVLANREEGAAQKQQAVLFRASHHSGPLEVELTRRNIPFKKFRGLKFLDAAHVKDMLALLRFVENLRELSIVSLRESDLEFVRHSQRLSYLRICHLPKVSVPEPLAQLKNLIILSLATLPNWDSSRKAQEIDSLEPISRMPALRHLDLTGARPSDRSLAPLEACPQLRTGLFHL